MANNQLQQPAWKFQSARWILWSVMAGVAAFVYWADHGELDQITRAAGTVVASSRTQVIQSQDGGVIEEMAVKEGMAVQANQLLLRFSAQRARSAYDEARAKAAALQSAVDRLQAEILDRPLKFNKLVQAFPDFVSAQSDLYRKRRHSLDDEIKAYDRALVLARQELGSTEPLLEKGDVGLAEVLRLRRQVADLEGQIVNRRNKYFQDAQAEFAKAQEDLASVEQLMAQRKLQLDNCEVRSPRAAIVKNIRFTTVGAVIRPSDDILELVPSDNDLLVEVKVRPADIGFIRPGLRAMVKLDAYDYAIYGGLDGEVVYISADTLKEESRAPQDSTYYLVRVRADKTQLVSKAGQRMDIIPGMTANAELLTGKRTVLSYLTKPISKTLGDAMKER
jgi:adhesin transport system membrane fusion protein